MVAPLTSLALNAAGIASGPLRQVKPPLVKVRTIFQRGEAPEILDVEANLDPLEILKAAGVGILVGGVALAAGWLLWDGLAAPTPVGPVQVFRGMKESPFWQGETERARDLLAARRAIKSGGTIVTAAPGADPSEVREDAECELLSREYQSAIRGGRDPSNFLAQAKAKGCRWSEGF